LSATSHVFPLWKTPAFFRSLHNDTAYSQLNHSKLFFRAQESTVFAASLRFRDLVTVAASEKDYSRENKICVEVFT
jgi:hypothetical protein